MDFDEIFIIIFWFIDVKKILLRLRGMDDFRVGLFVILLFWIIMVMLGLVNVGSCKVVIFGLVWKYINIVI